MNRSIIRLLAFTAIGAVGGYAYYHFIGCASGTCPLTSNPFISTGYGAALGLIWGIPTKKRTR